MNSKVKNATETNIEGIKFKSKLEGKAYNLFREANLNVNPIVGPIVLQDSFKPSIVFYKANKGNIEEDCRKVRQITYTPDFTILHNNITYYIETKGFRTDSYNIKVKLFRKWLEEQDNVVFVELYSVRDIKAFINKLVC